MDKETELRQWLRDNIGPNIIIQWVEPGRYGSTIGAADAILSCGKQSVGLELKIWKHTKRGIKCVMRPVQRRWHHMNMREGKRTAVLFHIDPWDGKLLVRGDHVPLRDYADDPDSGCVDGKLRAKEVFMDLDRHLFDESYGFWL